MGGYLWGNTCMLFVSVYAFILGYHTCIFVLLELGFCRFTYAFASFCGKYAFDMSCLRGLCESRKPASLSIMRGLYGSIYSSFLSLIANMFPAHRLKFLTLHLLVH